MYLPSNNGIRVSVSEDIKAIINSHLGRKPVSGGRPPNERRSRINMLLEAKEYEVIFIN